MLFFINIFKVIMISALLFTGSADMAVLFADENEVVDGASEEQAAASEDAPRTEEKPVSEDPAGTSLDESVIALPSNAGDESPGQNKKESAPEKRIKKVKKAEKIEPESPPMEAQPAAKVQIPEGAEISQGERIVIEGKGFSIKPPVGWIVQRDVHRVSLTLAAPVPEGQYPSNINVIRFSGAKIINQETAEKFAEKIIKDFPAASPTIDAYTLRNSQPIDLADGRKALMFYTDFLGSGRKMMQAHVLASSETNHYLITYTDAAENFEPNAEGVQSQVFNLAWETLASLELDSPNPVPSQELTWILSIVGILVIAWFVFSFIRNRRAAAEYRQFADRGHLPGDHDELVSSLAQVGVGQKVSLEPTLMSMPKSELESMTPELADPLSGDAEPVRGKKIKVAKRGKQDVKEKKWEEISDKASEVSSIEFSQDKFKREI
ncbi:MAG: hypothetical protein WCL28_01390 [bacterium]